MLNQDTTNRTKIWGLDSCHFDRGIGNDSFGTYAKLSEKLTY